MKNLAGAGLAALVLTGCASIVDGTSQEIAINSTPEGAGCELERQTATKEIIGRIITPQTLKIKKTKHDIKVTCQKPGYQSASTFMKSKIQDSTWGNIILGGGIGWAIDSARGADNKYEKYLTVTLVPELAAQAPAAVTPPAATTPAEAAPAVAAPVTTPEATAVTAPAATEPTVAPK